MVRLRWRLHVWAAAAIALALLVFVSLDEIARTPDPDRQGRDTGAVGDAAAVPQRAAAASPLQRPPRSSSVRGVVARIRESNRRHRLKEWWAAKDPSSRRIDIGGSSFPPGAVEVTHLINELCRVGLSSKAGMEEILELVRNPEDPSDPELLVRFMSPNQMVPWPTTAGESSVSLDPSVFDLELAAAIAARVQEARSPWEKRALAVLAFLTMGWNTTPRPYSEEQIRTIVAVAEAEEDFAVHTYLVQQLMYYVSQSASARRFVLESLDRPAPAPFTEELVRKLQGFDPGGFREGADDAFMVDRHRVMIINGALERGIEITQAGGVEFVLATLDHPNPEGRKILFSRWGLPLRGLPDAFYEGRAEAGAAFLSGLMGRYDLLEPEHRRAALGWLRAFRTPEAAAFVAERFMAEYLAMEDAALEMCLEQVKASLTLTRESQDYPGWELADWEALMGTIAADAQRAPAVRRSAQMALVPLVMRRGLDEAGGPGARLCLQRHALAVAESNDPEVRALAAAVSEEGARWLQEYMDYEAILQEARDR